MYFLAPYGVQTDIEFAMVKRGVVDLAATADWTPATGDTKIIKAGANAANTTNNPAAIAGTGSVTWKLTLTATELTADRVQIQIVDSATKAVEDQFFTVYTYGDASAKIPLPAALVSGRIDASVGAVAANAITDASVSTDMDSYAAKIWVIKEGTTADHYAVRWFKNGSPITSGITSPTIQVIKGSDGTDLIASTALTEIGSTHRFKKDESTNKMVAGAIYFAVVSATIDGSTRSFDQQVGRDST
jgi:hypothetical protein